jgi:hypothetical protein
MRQLSLTAPTDAVLAFIRRTEFPLSVYGRSAARVWPMVREQVDRRISRFGVPVHQVNIYRRYVAEMLKAFRTETGEPLAAALELCVRKWTNLGLETELLEQLLIDCHRKFHATGHQPPKRRPIVPATKPGPRLRRRHKRTYAEALAEGRTSRRPAATIAEQSTSHAAGIARNRDISRKLAVLLKDRGIPGKEFIRYNAFAQKLGRLSRKYGGQSLPIAASNLIDYYEARSLDGNALRAVAATVFDINLAS